MPPPPPAATNHADPPPERAVRAARCNRRALLAGAATLIGGGALAGCTGVPTPAWQGAEPRVILPSPTSGQPATPLATPQPGGLDVGQFLALSSVLTGFDDLSPTLGGVYLGAVEANQDASPTLNDLYEQAGFGSGSPPATVDDLAAAGIYDDERLGGLADTITEYWYTGIVDQGEEQVVATYVDALAWRSLGYGAPRTICEAYSGAWRDRPPEIPQG